MKSMLFQLILGMNIMNFMSNVPEIILNTFKEYPYLHSPSLEEKKEYVAWFAHHDKGMILIARREDKIIGLLTGIPMEALNDSLPEIEELFDKQGLNLENYYYCGDVIVLPEYQNQGICSTMFALFEREVKSWGFKGIALITSIREENHPLKPKDYRDPSKIWQHYGFEKTPIILKNFQPTVIDEQGTVQERENFFALWIKKYT